MIIGGLIDQPPPDDFRQLLSAAWRARPLAPADVTRLAAIKFAWARTGVGLTHDELVWLHNLAKRGGWRRKYPFTRKENINA